MAITRRARRPRRNWPVCAVTGKRRLGERKDAKLALAAARQSRARAERNGVRAEWTVVRAYRCRHCAGGWHLTSVAHRGGTA
ncbi:hypothetical protein Sipo8835_05825 [Streptomyces ipomoeae]|uniref:Uncharacterized protein n=2 Tax=Streptomyces ipomoeae TaxID=103232 RepID=L1KNM3_9ACTN|nr:hypothetical protein [Streptomyces ipomoeae]EKX62159.1 hypothetical protein STRIP9103_00201 [Streptomyces ipomoeae 91-03]MDX2698394.1 hypothetical protein [Streptomyces ipomoeae]MDX2825690.1 hypothetical protein [Streptomyces ipomoeae]MDX2837764.1 hypothetical protein [Streptomyces ipomoeae]MDX2872257.1 hypothetical protein [Streptomyces ipomoeae]